MARNNRSKRSDGRSSRRIRFESRQPLLCTAVVTLASSLSLSVSRYLPLQSVLTSSPLLSFSCSPPIICRARPHHRPSSWTNSVRRFIATSPTIAFDGETTWSSNLGRAFGSTLLPRCSTMLRPSLLVRRYRHLRMMKNPFQVMVDSSQYR